MLLFCASLQTVHFIRHGEGWHNVGIVNENAALTDFGWAQAHALGKHIESLAEPLALQVSSRQAAVHKTKAV